MELGKRGCVRKQIEVEIAGLERWVQTHSRPKTGDKDVNPQYLEEYMINWTRLGTLKDVLPYVVDTESKKVLRDGCGKDG